MQYMGLSLLSLALLALSPAAALAGDDDGVVGPGEAPADVYHPDREREVTPRYGGRVIVHLSSLPESICYPIENSAVTRRILYEVHETLGIQDWEWHDYRPRAAESWVTEDMLVLTPAGAANWAGKGAVDVRVKRQGEVKKGQSVHRAAKAIYGQLEQAEDGWIVTPISKGSALEGAVTVPAADIAAIERMTVFTFSLRPGMRWHPSVVFERTNKPASERLKGQTLDARDVYFSWSVYQNSFVDCDQIRFQFEKTTGCEIVDDMTVRFFFEGQYAFATDSLATSLTLLPSHIYDLTDPDNPDHREHVTPKAQGKHVNENPHNQLWVGLGPYRVTHWTQQYVQAERFTDAAGKCLYFDRDKAGYMDTIRWRYISDDESSMNALLNGELDYFERIKSADYYGERTNTDLFKDSLYKGYKYLGTFNYTGWNLYQPQLKDLAVRKAIAHAFDFQEYLRTNYKGLGRQVTGAFPYNSEAYDHSVKPLAHDIDLAYELLDDAGWYDRNGDGTRDRDGVELVIDFLMPSGNVASRNIGLKLQESLAELEIKVNLVKMEWATFLDKLRDRQFDSSSLAWVQPLESDPEQLWHSKWGEYEARGSNHSGVMDPKLDEMIARGQRELDYGKRQAIWHEMHRYIYEHIQPYMFMYNIPNKYGMTKRIRGFQAVKIDPGYVIRRWYFWDPKEPGTRSTLDR